MELSTDFSKRVQDERSFTRPFFADVGDVSRRMRRVDVLKFCLQRSSQTARVFRSGSVPSSVFVSDGALNAVLKYPAGVLNPKPIARITAGIAIPLAVATDGAGTLYVYNQVSKTANDVRITEYPAGSTTPSVTNSGNHIRHSRAWPWVRTVPYMRAHTGRRAGPPATRSFPVGSSSSGLTDFTVGPPFVP